MSTPRLQWIALLVVLALVIAFVVSFVLGMRADAPVATRQRDRDLPGVFSGRRVEVLNAAGRAGLARQATEMLRDAGFDVVYFGNAPNADTASMVIDRVGKMDIAEAAARALGITRVTTELDSTRLVETTIVLGSNWSRPATPR